MNVALRDRLAGVVLLLVSVIWIAGVYWTIPGDPGGSRIGPRGFPLAMGIGLAFLAIMLIAAGFIGAADKLATADDPEAQRQETRIELWAVVHTFGFVILYTLVLDWLGFIPATFLVTEWVHYRVGSPPIFDLLLGPGTDFAATSRARLTCSCPLISLKSVGTNNGSSSSFEG